MRNLNCFFCLAVIAGCAAEYSPATSGTELTVEENAAASAGHDGGETSEPSSSSAVEPSIKPRIIYTAEVRIVADDFAVAADEVARLVKQTGGYIATASLDRRSGSSRLGQWTIRVPVEQFDVFLASLDTIGFVESRSQSSQDVTMEYVDVEARIANLKRLEERFVKLLEERTGKLEDVLQVEQELARVRGDIEQAEGRLRYLSNRTNFSTVTLTVREQKDYVPPKAPSFGERIATTWSQSLQALREAGEIAALIIVAVVPWMLVLSVPILALVTIIKLTARRRRRNLQV